MLGCGPQYSTSIPCGHPLILRSSVPGTGGRMFSSSTVSSRIVACRGRGELLSESGISVKTVIVNATLTEAAESLLQVRHWVGALAVTKCCRYIGTEFIYYLLSPIYLLSLHKAPRIGFALSVATILLSCVFNVIGMLHWNFPPTQLLWKQPKIFSADFIKVISIFFLCRTTNFIKENL